MVVQLGHDEMPLGRCARSSGLTSAITSGTSGSMRNAAELSTTIAPAAAACGVHSSERSSSTSTMTRSRPSKQPDRRTSHVTSPSRNGSLRPSERGDAYARSSPTGKLRSSRMRSISVPTMPVAPSRPTRTSPLPFHVIARPPARTRRAAPAPPARRRRSCTTHEMRIVDVLIISMLMPSVASTSNIFAATPGCVFMPAPTSETRPTSSSVRKPGRLGLDDDLVHLDRCARDVVARQRERDVGVARGRDVLHDHVDVDAGFGERAEQRWPRRRAGRVPARS